jgi:hypothetical protein
MAAALAFSLRETDPIARFIAQLRDEPPVFAQSWARETLRLRDEFTSHATALLSAPPREAVAHADWIRDNASVVAFRWAALRESAARFAAIDFRPIRIA